MEPTTLDRKPLKSAFPFSLCLVAEEIGSDFERTLAFAKSLDIDYIELGHLWGERIDGASFAAMVRARELLRTYGMSVRLVATDAFKPVMLGSIPPGYVTRDPHYLSHLALVEVAIEAAKFFDAPMARVFSFRRDTITGLGNPSPRFSGGGEFPQPLLDRAMQAYAPALEAAEAAGIVLALENVRSCWCDSGRNTAKLLDALDSPWIKAIWDPANAFVSGEEDVVAGGYAAVRKRTTHVHLKDAVVLDEKTGLTEWTRIGDGGASLKDQLRSLREDKFDGCISIETHWRPEGSDREENTRKTYEGLMRLLSEIQ